MKFSEPVTAITDYILALELFFLGFLLFRAGTGQLSVHLWIAAFAVLGLAAITGGTFHAGRDSFSSAILARIWRTTICGILLSLLLFIAAGAVVSTAGAIRFWLIGLLAGCGTFGLSHLNDTAEGRDSGSRPFPVVAILFALVALVLLVQLSRSGPAAGNWILGGSLMTLAGLAVLTRGKQWAAHFNQNDLFHLITMIAVYFLYRGGLLLRDCRL